MSDDRKAIEDYLKLLLFKNSSGTISPDTSQQEVVQHGSVSSAGNSDVFTETPFNESKLGGQSNLSHYSPPQSELIDFDALTKFTARHLEDSNACSLNEFTNSDALSEYTFFSEFIDPMVGQNDHSLENNKEVNFAEPKRSPKDVEKEKVFGCNSVSPSHLPDDLPLSLPTEMEKSQNSLSESCFYFKSEISDTNAKVRDKTDYYKEKRKTRKALRKEKKEKKRKNREEVVKPGPSAILQRPRQDSSETSIPKRGVDAPGNKSFQKELVNPVNHVSGAFTCPNSVRVYSVARSRQGKWSFTCEVCAYNTIVESLMLKHIQSPSHIKLIKLKEADKLLPYLPEPLQLQISLVDDLIKTIAIIYGLTAKDIEGRKLIATRINKLVLKNIPDCSVGIVGSSVSEMGLKVTAVDLVLKVPSKVNAADRLATTHQLLIKDRGSVKVYNEFREKIPRIQFTDLELNLTCNITLDNGNSLNLTKLLLFYASLDFRVPVLGKAFSYWARICDINDPEKGTLPSFCYNILLIYFLQQVKPPVLPVLQETPKFLEADDVESFKNMCNWHSENQSPVGLLWIQLFHFYCFKYQPGQDVISVCSSKKITCQDKNWGTKFFAIEDPFVHRNLAHVIPNHSVFQYIQNCFVNTYRYFAYPQMETGEVKIASRYTPCSNTLHFPFTCGTSTTCSTADVLTESSETLDNDTCLNINDLLEDHDDNLPFDDVISTVSKMSLGDVEGEMEGDHTSDTEKENGVITNLQNTSYSSPTSSVKSELYETPCKTKNNGIPQGTSSNSTNDLTDKASLYYWDLGNVKLTKSMLRYEFLRKIFRGDKVLPLVCRICQKTGHLKNDCPNEVLPPIITLPPMTKQFMNHIIDVCLQIRNENQPSALEYAERNQDRKQLQSYIQEIYPNAVLRLFGSFCNGFGFAKSDMDFCLTFRDDDGKELDQAHIIETLANKLKKNQRFQNVTPIISAKVPIVKFFDKKSGLESDISLYNTLAQYNTRMLDTYCKIDIRVQIIGYVFKYFAKTLDICDASKGSLSSYAYILMAIFFLQQRKPPVIPVLQELYEGEMPNVTVDEWNVWFFDDISRLREVWPEYKQNTETVGELWLGLLSFYASEFNMKEYVISIKQKKLLSRFQKLWNSKKIAIEDPFDLNHNLGSGLSRKMNNYIMKAFIRGREHFGTPVSDEFMYQSNSNGPRGYLFDRRLLNKGTEPPKDRGCRCCGKIGHLLKDCPSKNPLVRKDKKIRKANMQSIGEQQQQQPQQQQKARENGLKGKLISPLKNSISPKKMPPKHSQPMTNSLERAPPGLPRTMSLERAPPGLPSPRPQKHFTSPPPGFDQNLFSQQLYSNGHMPHYLLPTQTFTTRPATSCPFPVSRPSDAFYASSNRSSQQTSMELQTQHWPQATEIDKFVRNEIWQQISQIPPQSQAQLHSHRQDQQILRPISAPVPPYRQIVPEGPRTSSDMTRFYSPFPNNC